MSLPRLSSQFFQDIAPSQELWETWGHKGNWSESLVPLYAWESILFVGIPPGASIPALGFAITAVEASAQDLKNYFKKIQASSRPLKIPYSAPVLAHDGVAADPFADLALDPVVATNKSSAPPSSTAALIDLAEELNGSLEEQDLAHTGDSFDIPDGLSLDSNTNPPPASENRTKPERMTDVNIIPEPMGPNDNLIEHVFKQLSRQFSKSMLLRKEGNALTPWQWDPAFQNKSAPQPITLGVPSPFRIVQRTMKPYHGYVVPGEVQEKFFDEWNSSQIPDHMTITPIVANDEVLGMLLSVGDKTINARAALDLSEKMAAEITNKLGTEPNLMAS